MNHIPKRTGLIPDVPERRSGCGIWFLVLIAIIVLRIGWTIVPSYFYSQECNLPHSPDKARELDTLIEQLTVDLTTNRHKTNIWYRPEANYLWNLSAEDQLHVFHQAIIGIGGLFHNENLRDRYVRYEYKISPIHLGHYFDFVDPSTWAHPWASFSFSIVRDLDKNTEKTKITKTHNFQLKFSGYDLTGTGSLKTITSRGSKNACPTAIGKRTPAKENSE